MKFKVVDAGELPKRTKVIARADGKSMTGDAYFVINADEPFAADVLKMITKKYGNIGDFNNIINRKESANV